jgi:hypothetical protein
MTPSRRTNRMWTALLSDHARARGPIDRPPMPHPPARSFLSGLRSKPLSGVVQALASASASASAAVARLAGAALTGPAFTPRRARIGPVSWLRVLTHVVSGQRAQLHRDTRAGVASPNRSFLSGMSRRSRHALKSRWERKPDRKASVWDGAPETLAPDEHQVRRTGSSDACSATAK